MIRREDLATAGRNLQAVAALLVPVVGFALSRPGLLALPFQPAWLLTSGVSLALYILAAWRTRRAFYSGLAGVAAASATLAALNDRALETQLIALSALFLPMQAIAGLLQRGAAPQLARGPRWVAHAGLSLSALAAGGLLTAGALPAAAMAMVLLIGAAYCGLLSALDRRPGWMWGVAALPPAALALALGDWGAGLTPSALSYAGLGLAYLAIGALLERRALAYVRPFFLGAPLVAVAAFGHALSAQAVRLSYPLLIGGLLAVVLLVQRGRLAWVGHGRPALAGAALGGAGLLLAAWLVPMLDLARAPWEWAGLALIALAALYLAGSRWWPGRVAVHYDRTLHALGALVSVAGGLMATFAYDTLLPAAALLSLVWLAQAALRRSPVWAGAGLGVLWLTGLIGLDRAGQLSDTAILLYSLAATGAYAIGGTRLRHGALRYWTWPALGWATVVGSLTVAIAWLNVVEHTAREPIGPLALLALAGLLGLLTWQWRQVVLGYPAALLLSAGALLCAGQGFYSAWQPSRFDLAYSISALVFGLALLGQWLRRFGRGYARPYELAALLLLPAAPFFATGSLPHLTISFALLALLYALASWRYRAGWAVAASLLSLDFALLHGSAWLIPGGSPAGAAWLIAVAVSVQALGALLARQLGARSQGLGVGGDAAPGAARPPYALWAYGAAAAGAMGALALGLGDTLALAGILSLFTAVLALVASVERSRPAAWAGGLGLVASLLAWHTYLGLTPEWRLAWLSLELLGLALVGWLPRRPWPQLAAIWALPSLGLPLVLGGLIPAALLGDLPALTFSLASYALVLATLAVRERSLYYAYGAGAAMVGSALSQLAHWGFENPQLYVLPAGLYLLALGAALRRFQRQPRPAQLVETLSVVMLLGVTFGQAVQADSLVLQLLLLCGEALLFLAYGALLRLRVPFVGGLAFFVVGVGWMGLNAARFTNQWVLGGIVGLLMIAAYVLLERHQERLVRAGRFWAGQLRSWT